MRLIQDQRVVGAEFRVGLRLRQQNAVGHHLDAGVGAHLVGKAYLPADEAAEAGFGLFRQTIGHALGGNAARLRHADLAALPAAQPAPGQQHNLGQLCGFAGTGFAADDDDLMRNQRRRDIVTARRNRQVFGEGQIRREDRRRLDRDWCGGL